MLRIIIILILFNCGIISGRKGRSFEPTETMEIDNHDFDLSLEFETYLAQQMGCPEGSYRLFSDDSEKLCEECSFICDAENNSMRKCEVLCPATYVSIQTSNWLIYVVFGLCCLIIITMAVTVTLGICLYRRRQIKLRKTRRLGRNEINKQELLESKDKTNLNVNVVQHLGSHQAHPPLSNTAARSNGPDVVNNLTSPPQRTGPTVFCYPNYMRNKNLNALAPTNPSISDQHI